MRTVKRPEDLPQDVYRICISTVRDSDLKEQLQRCETEIVSASEEFAQKVAVAELYTMSPMDDVAGVCANELVKVYTLRMAGAKSPGRVIYDRLKSLPKHGICPFCSQRTVSTLDHFLPKAEFPALVISPDNLVASCKDCNFLKTDKSPESSNDQLLHPYFDDIEDDYWLNCKVTESQNIVFEFFVSPPSGWEPQLVSRLIWQFETLKLGELYSSHAADEYVSIYMHLITVFDAGGTAELQKFLSEAEASRSAIHKNSWQSAFYRCIASNEWFCNGGFRL